MLKTVVKGIGISLISLFGIVLLLSGWIASMFSEKILIQNTIQLTNTDIYFCIGFAIVAVVFITVIYTVIKRMDFE